MQHENVGVCEEAACDVQVPLLYLFMHEVGDDQFKLCKGFFTV
jgi:hypothetical protein